MINLYFSSSSIEICIHDATSIISLHKKCAQSRKNGRFFVSISENLRNFANFSILKIVTNKINSFSEFCFSYLHKEHFGLVIPLLVCTKSAPKVEKMDDFSCPFPKICAISPANANQLYQVEKSERAVKYLFL